MRLRIKLNLTQKSITINYRTMIQGIIYNAIGYNDYSTNLHNKGKVLEKRPFKLFVFSNLIGKSKYIKEKQELYFLSNGYFEISSFDSTLIEKLSEFLLSNSYMLFGKEVIDIIGYDIVNEYFKISTEMVFSTNSPVVYNLSENKKPQYLNPNTEEYKEAIIKNINKKYYLCYNENAPDFNIIKFDQVKELKVYFRKVFYICYDYNITFINLSSKLLNVIMSTGIGTKNSMGFGMLKYEEENLSI